MKYNVLYLNKSAEIGGSETSLLLLLRYLDRDVYHPIVVLPSNGPFLDQLHQIGVKVIAIPLGNIYLKGRNPLPYLTTVFRLVKIIRSEKIRLVHSNNHTSNQYGAIAAKLCGIPIVCHMREMNSRSNVNRALLPLADKLIANSVAVAQSYLAYRKEANKITVIYNGLDLANWPLKESNDADYRQRMNISANTFVMAIIGGIYGEKGHDILIRALAKVAERCENFYLLIVGPTEEDASASYQLDKTYLRELRWLVADIGLRQRVIFTGTQRDIAAVYRSLDLLVLPTLREGFGRVLIEAMAMQKPVVASQVGGVPEVVEDGVTGFLVPPGDPKALARAILKVMLNKELAIELGKNGRSRVERMFVIEEHIPEMEKVYLELLSKRGKLTYADNWRL